MRVTGPGDFFFKPFFVEESLGNTREKERKGEGMSKMMDRWLQKAKEGDKGLTRPPASARVSQHKNEVRSIARGFFQSQFRVSAYKSVGRPRHWFVTDTLVCMTHCTCFVSVCTVKRT